MVSGKLLCSTLHAQCVALTSVRRAAFEDRLGGSSGIAGPGRWMDCENGEGGAIDFAGRWAGAPAMDDSQLRADRRGDHAADVPAADFRISSAIFGRLSGDCVA